MDATQTDTFTSFSSTWCLAAAIGPVVGGSLAAQGQWRWLFCTCDINAHSLSRDAQSTRPQPPHLTYWVSFGRRLLGSTHSPWQLPGQIQTHELDVGLTTMDAMRLTSISLTEATSLLSRAPLHTRSG